jgi:hypothetical protein
VNFAPAYLNSPCGLYFHNRSPYFPRIFVFYVFVRITRYAGPHLIARIPSQQIRLFVLICANYFLPAGSSTQTPSKMRSYLMAVALSALSVATAEMKNFTINTGALPLSQKGNWKSQIMSGPVMLSVILVANVAAVA